MKKDGLLGNFGGNATILRRVAIWSDTGNSDTIYIRNCLQWHPSHPLVYGAIALLLKGAGHQNCNCSTDRKCEKVLEKITHKTAAVSASGVACHFNIIYGLVQIRRSILTAWIRYKRRIT